MDSELRELEEELGRLAPGALPEGLISRMEAAMDGWQETEREEKVVPFPAQGAEVQSGGLWKAVAAVAILGAAAALLVPGQSPNQIAEATSTTSPATIGLAKEEFGQVSFEPLSAGRDVVRTDNQGLVLVGGDTPHQCMRVEYLEHYEFEGKDGQALRISKPAVDFILIPVRSD